VLLVVNVASKCGLTPQYEGLESLYRDDKDRGLEILGFPCNQFREQEPGTDAPIQDFCKTTYDVTFPVLAKIEVSGSTKTASRSGSTPTVSAACGPAATVRWRP
jgi:glutathione peroxidase